VIARILFWLLSASLLAGCSPNVPEPDSPGARLYVKHCNGCHRVFAPGSLKYAMWEFQLERMQGEMVRRGVSPLTPDEKETVLAYLRRHSNGAPKTED